MLYIFVVCSLFIFLIYYDILRRKNGKKIVYWGSIFVLWAISAFSYRLGTDTLNYMYEFDHETRCISEWTWSYIFETDSRQPGWMIFISIIKSVIPSFVFFKIIYAFILNYSIASFIKNYVENRFTALLLYVCFMYFTLNFEILREGLSISLFLFSVKYYINRRWFLYYITLSFSFAFHFSIAPFLLLPIWSLISNLKFKIVLVAIMSVCIMLFSTYTQNLFYNLVLVESLQDKSVFYFGSDKYNTSLFSISNLINYILNIGFPLLLLYKDSLRNRKYEKISDFIMAYVLIYAISLQLPIFYRFNNYLNMFYILVYIGVLGIEISLLRFSKKTRTFIYLVGVIGFCVLKLNVLLTPINNIPNYYRYYPYSSIFTKEKDSNREKIYRYTIE